ncbi:MAG TPA: glycosyltransferase 87 family protein, partial [Nitriliruptorales bacterium]|nr:glycosyltransferase 87 family protein [Nitriliruptorales bacterium]
PTAPTVTAHPAACAAGRWALLAAVELAVVAWLVAHVRGRPGPAPAQPAPPRAAVVVLLVTLTLAVRVPLAWLDPGIGAFARASGIAAQQLLAGENPYTRVNPRADAGTYQYPAASLLVHTAFVAVLPGRAWGEDLLDVRAVLWATDVAAVVLLAAAGSRLGGRRAGTAAALLYAVHPTLVRESAIVVANDLIVALAAAAAAVAAVNGRRLLAGLLVGLAISVKPAAVVLVPVLLLAQGVFAAGLAGVTAIALQVPFLLLPSPGLHGLVAMAEPVTRPEPLELLIMSVWYPLYAATGGAPPLDVTAAVGVVAALATATWAGWRLRRWSRTPPVAACAAYALPLLVAAVFAPVQRHNYQGWYLTSFLLAASLTTGRATDGATDTSFPPRQDPA